MTKFSFKIVTEDNEITVDTQNTTIHKNNVKHQPSKSNVNPILQINIIAQEVLIQDLKHNPAILPLKLGLARIRTSKHDFIHYFHLRPLAEEINALEKQYRPVTSEIQEGLTHPYSDQLQNIKQSLQYLLIVAKQKLRSIYPEYKLERGLTKGLGSIIKVISGNLDQEDVERYDKAIASLEKNQNNIISEIDRH